MLVAAPPGGVPILGRDFQVGPDAAQGSLPICSYCGLKSSFHNDIGHSYMPPEARESVPVVAANDDTYDHGYLIRFYDGAAPTAHYLAREALKDEDGHMSMLTRGTSGAFQFSSPDAFAIACQSQTVRRIVTHEKGSDALPLRPVAVWASDPDRMCQWWVNGALQGPPDLDAGTLVLSTEPWHALGEQANRAAAFDLIPRLKDRAKKAAKDKATGQQSLLSLFDAA